VVYYDTSTSSLNRHGEELCGDQVKILRTSEKLIVVLSDGLGSGVKATILARLTAEILMTMFRERVPLPDVLETVFATLPTCKVRLIAYAAFIVVEVELATGRYHIVNFDCPPPFLVRARKIISLTQREEIICNRKLHHSEGVLELEDFLGVISDGVLYAGMGVMMNFGWGRDQIGDYLEQIARRRPATAEMVVRRLMEKTASLYGGEPGDDATLVGILVRKPNRLMVFTGPPVDKNRDEEFVNRLMNFDGRKVVCGGTTGNIVAEQLGEVVRMDFSTLREDVPPIGLLADVDLMTEGVLTLARTLRLLKDSGGNINRVPVDRNGASLLAREFLRADEIFLLVGEQMNEYYHNPLLPRNISIRHNLMEQLVETLGACHKVVTIEWC
jgi:hypothetical protein